MVIKSDQERVRALITEAITVLCKNGLTFRAEFQVEGLLGITLDQDEVFLVNIKQTIKSEGMQMPHDGDNGTHNGTPLQTRESAVAIPQSQPSNTASLHATPSRPGQRARRKRSAGSRSSTPQEKSDSNQTFPTDPTQLSLSDEPVFGSDLMGDVSDLNSRNDTGQPPSKRHAMDSEVSKDSTENEQVVVKEEALSDNEEGDTEGYDSYNQTGYEDEEGNEDPRPGCSAWDPGSANAYSDSPGSAVVPSMTTAQSQISNFFNPNLNQVWPNDTSFATHKFEPINEDVVIDCQKEILLFAGPEVTARNICRKASKYKVAVVETAMMGLDRGNPEDPYHFGEYFVKGRIGAKGSKLFVKAHPSKVKGPSLHFYNISEELYKQCYFAENKSEKKRAIDALNMMSSPRSEIEADYAKRCILLCSGPVVNARAVCRSKKVKAHEVEHAMKAMDSQPGTGQFVGRCVPWVRYERLIFFKAPPEMVSPEALEALQITPEIYNNQYHVTTRMSDGLRTDWEGSVESLMMSSPFGAASFPLESMNLKDEALIRLKEVQIELAKQRDSIMLGTMKQQTDTSVAEESTEN